MSATPLRGPYRFMPVLAGQEMFKVAVGNLSRQNEDSKLVDSAAGGSKINITASNNTLRTNARPGDPESKPPKSPKRLTRWAPRLIGKKLFVEGNLLQEE